MNGTMEITGAKFAFAHQTLDANTRNERRWDARNCEGVLDALRCKVHCCASCSTTVVAAIYQVCLGLSLENVL